MANSPGQYHPGLRNYRPVGNSPRRAHVPSAEGQTKREGFYLGSLNPRQASCAVVNIGPSACLRSLASTKYLGKAAAERAALV